MHSAQPTPDYFQEIYDAAKSNDETKIKQLIEKKVVSIDCLDGQGLFTPGGKLAREKNNKACMLLIKKGANVSAIAMGAASVGDRAFAEYLRKKWGARIDVIAQGAAMCQDTDYAEWLREKYQVSLTPFAKGASFVGNFAYFEELKKHYSATSHYLAVISSVEFAALGGHENYIKSHLAGETTYLTFEAIACGAARAKNEAILQAIINDAGSYLHVEKNILKNAAMGGHLEYAQKLAGYFISISPALIIRGAASSGHYAKALPDQSDLASQAALYWGSIEGGHALVFNKDPRDPVLQKIEERHLIFLKNLDLNYLAKLVNADYFKEKLLDNFCESVHEHESLSSPELMLHTFTFTDQSFLKKLAIAFEKHKIALIDSLTKKSEEGESQEADKIFLNQFFAGKEHFLQLDKIITKAENIRKIMTTFDFDYDQASAFSKSVRLRELLISVMKPSFIFPKTVVAEILTHLTNLNNTDIVDMIEKFSLIKLKELLDKAITKYCQESSNNSHKEHAKELLGALPTFSSTVAIKEKINFQLRLFDNLPQKAQEDGYPQILKKYSR